MPRPTSSSGWKPTRAGFSKTALLIIGRQVPTDLGKSIDLLGVDREGNVVVVELKRDRTPRDVVAQALEYAAFAAGLDAAALESILGEYHPDELMGLAEYHRKYFDQSEAVAFNKDQRIVIIGQQVTPEIRQTARFLGHKGIPVTCVEFTFFQAAGGGRLLSQEIVVGGEQAKPRGRPRRTAPLSRAEFLESCDDHGRAVYSRILDLVDRKGMLLRWGTTSFNIVADIDCGATTCAAATTTTEEIPTMTNNQATLHKLDQMRLHGMARALRTSLDSQGQWTADELLAHLVDAECDDRHERRLKRLLKAARFRYPAAIEEVDFALRRNLDQNQLLRLADCRWVGRTKFPVQLTRL